MRGWTALLVIAVLAPVGAQIDAEARDCAPPCGWILPQLDIVVDDKLACGGGHLIFAEGPPDDCYPILEPGETRSYTGLLIWKWEVSDEGTYPKEVGTDIRIGFSGTSTNGAWLSVDVTGDDMVDGHFIIDDAALVDPDNFRTITSEQGETVWFWYERPIDITFTREGDPGSDDVRRIGDREGVLPYFVKGTSSESGARFKEAFGIEEMRFDTCQDAAIAAQVEPCPATTAPPQDEDAPGLPVMMLLLALFIARRSIGR